MLRYVEKQYGRRLKVARLTSPTLHLAPSHLCLG